MSFDPLKFDPAALAKQIIANEEGAERAASGYRWLNADLLDAGLPAGDVTSTEVVKAKIAVGEALDRQGAGITTSTIGTWLLAARRNPIDKRNGISITAALECGDHPDRFTWYAEFGSGLGKRQVRRLRGDRKLDSVVPLSDAERERSVSDLLGGMSDDQLEKVVLGNPKAAGAFLRATSRLGDKSRREANDRDDIPNVEPGDDFAEFIRSSALGMRRRLNSVNGRSEFPAHFKAGVQIQLKELEEVIGWARSWAEGEDLADELAAFLATEAS